MKKWTNTTTLGIGLAMAVTLAASAQLNNQANWPTAVRAQTEANVIRNAMATFPYLPPEEQGSIGIFYSVQNPDWPPLPGNIHQLPAWAIDSQTFAIDDLDYDYSARPRASRTLNSLSIPGFDEGGEGGNPDSNSPPDISNHLKFMAQFFSVIDTNAAAVNDTNLYGAVLGFPEVAGTNSTLQMMPYKSDCLLFKASHFDYSSETRDFCLLICDKVETPVYKYMDLSTPTNNIQNGGWLVQGSIPAGQVSETTYLMVSNISRVYNGFFRVVPYGGPVIQVAGFSAYDTVSNSVTFQVGITDLSGVTNTQFTLDVGGVPAVYNVGASNLVTLDTKYNWSGWENVNFSATDRPVVGGEQGSTGDNAKLFFSGATTLPLDFENPVFLAYQSDEASLDVGQNDIDFYATVQVTVTATITDLDSGRLLKSFSGVADPGYIPLYWNYTESDGATPWTNEQYIVSFSANAASSVTTMTLTNKIDTGVKMGSGCLIAYQEENPGDITGSYWNTKAAEWAQNLKQLYTDIYGWASLTQYSPSDCGANRNHAQYYSLGNLSAHWADFLPATLTNVNYSDFDIIGAHCNGETVGYSLAFYPDKFSTTNLFDWLGDKHAGSSWRLRRTTIWACWSGELPGVYSGYLSFPEAVGIRPVTKQMTTYCHKNAGLFFGGRAPQIFVHDGNTITSAQASTMLDEAFMCGANPWPGGCDPTYSFRWAITSLAGAYPEMMFEPKADGSPSTTSSQPLGVGCPKLIFTTTHDSEITTLNFNAVKEVAQ